MGRNRKWVLENNLQEAVWKTILRGPRPPSQRWEQRNSSDVANAAQIRSRKRQRRQSVSPDNFATAARARVERLEALEVLEAQPFKTLLKKAQERTRVLPIGERMDSSLKFIQRSKARIEKQQAELSREQDLLQQALVNLERPREEAAISVAQHASGQSHAQQMHVEVPNEELQRLRAQVADMQAERDAIQEVEATRTKKARTLSSPSADLVSIQSGGVGCVRTQSDGTWMRLDGGRCRSVVTCVCEW